MSDEFQASKPTHRLKVLVTGTKSTHVVGAAWKRKDGSFLIKLDPCVVMSWKDDIVISLFPIAGAE